MRIDGRTDPQFAFRFRVIDARSGMRSRVLGTVYADDESHVLGCISMSKLLDVGQAEIVEIHVPKVVIDLDRDTILINVGELSTEAKRREEATA